MGRKKRSAAKAEDVCAWQIPQVKLAGSSVLTAESPYVRAIPALEAMRRRQLAPIQVAGADGAPEDVVQAAISAAQDGDAMGVICMRRGPAHAHCRRAHVWSHSYNDGARRWTCIQPAVHVAAIGGELDASVRYVGYLELVGTAIDATALAGARIARPMVKHREMRDGMTHHVTLVSPPDMELVLGEAARMPIQSEAHQAAARELLERIGHVLRADFTDRGLGMVQDEHSNRVYYRIIEWPSGQAARKLLGLPPAAFHITLGFSKYDLHDVDKGISTRVEAPLAGDVDSRGGAHDDEAKEAPAAPKPIAEPTAQLPTAAPAASEPTAAATEAASGGGAEAVAAAAAEAANVVPACTEEGNTN